MALTLRRGGAKLRVLLASDFYAPFIGGAERQVQLLAGDLARRGNEVHVATVRQNNLPEKTMDGDVQLHRLNGLATRVPWFSKESHRRFHPPFPEPGIVWGLSRLIENIRPDVVHAGGWIVYSCIFALLGWRIPFIISARDYGYGCPKRTLLHHGRICSGPGFIKCIECSRSNYGLPKAIAATLGVLGNRKNLIRKVSAIHSVSTFVQTVMERDLLQLPLSRTTLRRITIADITAEPASGVGSEPPEPADLPREPFILFVGALQANKGLGILLTAYDNLLSPPPLVVIGTIWPDTPKKFPRGVKVIFDAPHDLVMYAWERCLFGVVPSILPDSLPGVIREAMSRGKAVIGTAVGGIVDIITDGTTGLLIPPGDVTALTNAMQTLIDNPDLREQLGKAGQEDVKRFTADTIVVQFENLYAELIDETRR